MQYNPYIAQCPTRLALDRITDKWVVLILVLLSHEPYRFNRLRREVDGITQKVLSQTLKKMERDGLITRQAFATVPVTVEYAITDLGRTLSDCVEALTRWAEVNIEQVLESQRRYDTAAQSGAPARMPTAGRSGARAVADGGTAAE